MIGVFCIYTMKGFITISKVAQEVMFQLMFQLSFHFQPSKENIVISIWCCRR